MAFQNIFRPASTHAFHHSRVSSTPLATRESPLPPREDFDDEPWASPTAAAAAALALAAAGAILIPGARGSERCFGGVAREKVEVVFWLWEPRWFGTYRIRIGWNQEYLNIRSGTLDQLVSWCRMESRCFFCFL